MKFVHHAPDWLIKQVLTFYMRGSERRLFCKTSTLVPGLIEIKSIYLFSFFNLITLSKKFLLIWTGISRLRE